MLSIKPEYVKKIVSGEKKYEYRKHAAKCKVEKIVIYSCAPEKSVVGEVIVKGILAKSKSSLWETTKEHGGISRAKYREYFADSKTAYAYELGDVTVYDKPKSLLDYGIKSAPQSFVYLNAE